MMHTYAYSIYDQVKNKNGLHKHELQDEVSDNKIRKRPRESIDMGQVQLAICLCLLLLPLIKATSFDQICRKKNSFAKAHLTLRFV